MGFKKTMSKQNINQNETCQSKVLSFGEDLGEAQ
jgi:hypothetical protein